MNWPTDLIKVISSSKSLVVATFVTSVVLLLKAESFYPPNTELSGNIRILLVGFSIFSGVLLFIIVLEQLKDLVLSNAGNVKTKILGRKLTGEEKTMLLRMGEIPDENIDVSSMLTSEYRLEAEQILNALIAKGFIERNIWTMNMSVYCLTDSGKKKILSIRADEKAN